MQSLFEVLAALLERSPNYRVLRRLAPQDELSKDLPGNPFTGIVLDTETTGMTAGVDEVIELGMLKFQYGHDSKIYRVLESFNRLQKPKQPIPAHITAITGIRDEDVAGCVIDAGEVEAFVKDAALIVAHNAKFDRPMCEAHWPIFRNFNWACSCTQIPWREEGHEGVKLGYLLNDYGRFHNGHRAIDDCKALLYLLAQPLARSQRLAMSALLETARKPQCRLFAENAPFDCKGLLKSRGYRWDAEVRCWSIVLDEAELEDEKAYLRREIYRGQPARLRHEKLTARNRFSLPYDTAVAR